MNAFLHFLNASYPAIFVAGLGYVWAVLFLTKRKDK